MLAIEVPTKMAKGTTITVSSCLGICAIAFLSFLHGGDAFHPPFHGPSTLTRCNVASTSPPLFSNESRAASSATSSNESGAASSASSSGALQTILGGGEQDTQAFFDDVWQRIPRVYRNRNDAPSVVDGSETNNPYSRQVDMGLQGIVRALENACQTFLEPLTAESQNSLPIVSRNRQCLSLQELAPLYGNDLFAAYLDGCSIIMNHVDRLCPNTASLCEDLQKTFPFAYANAYLTPPASQAVAAHADDRDVFVIQVYGQKAWRVYEEIPIHYPYPHEQVGKNGMPVPQSVLDGPCSVDTVLRQGDVLYIPRGHVHQATTHTQGDDEAIQPSFHITIALATFDWALSGLMATAVKKTLDEIPEYRAAIPLAVGMHDNAQEIPVEQRRQLERHVDAALEIVRKELTTEAINDYLRQKYQWHTSKSAPQRMQRVAQATSMDQRSEESTACNSIIGPEAMKHINMASWVRPSTPDEQALLSNIRQKRAPAMREETSGVLSEILGTMRNEPSPVQISQILKLVKSGSGSGSSGESVGKYVCDLTLLSFIRSCVERGELSVVAAD